MNPIYISVLPEETGNRIRSLMNKKKLCVKDIQGACGFEQPQAVYKWLKGQSLPSYESMAVLSVLFETPIDGILVTNVDASFFYLRILDKRNTK